MELNESKKFEEASLLQKYIQKHLFLNKGEISSKEI
jgi:hypothetical protein